MALPQLWPSAAPPKLKQNCIIDLEWKFQTNKIILDSRKTDQDIRTSTQQIKKKSSKVKDSFPNLS
jgi:hypothetical protein